MNFQPVDRTLQGPIEEFRTYPLGLKAIFLVSLVFGFLITIEGAFTIIYTVARFGFGYNLNG